MTDAAAAAAQQDAAGYGGYGSSSNNNDWVTVTALAAVTLQILRVSIDLIQVASLPSSSEAEAAAEEEDDDAAKQGQGGDASAADAAKASKTKSSSSTQYGSLDKAGAYGKNDTGDEEQPLLQPFSSSTASLSLSFRRRQGRRVRILAFAGAWCVLAVVFLGVRVLQMTTRFSSQLVTASALVLVMELYLLQRDADKERYGSVQRVFHLWTALLLWLVYISVFFGSPAAADTDTGGSNRSGSDWTLMGAATLHLALVLLEGWLISSTYWFHLSSLSVEPTPTTATAAAPDDKTATTATTGGTKATLSRKAVCTLLKPYFWPDATDSSATMNRIRAIATWVCVVSSKACSLTAPLLLGWASTALAHQDYVGACRYSVGYAIISWTGSTLKEGQSLVYLRVAQAAYVQLSTTAFEHLHSLSLDWHLRKKMGVVLRSMSRGIAACDTLMKYLFLWLVPALAECIVVCIIFATYFSYLPLAISVFYFVFLYVVFTILVTLWRKKFRKALVRSDNEMEDRFVDSMINFETVKYFTAETYEKERYNQAVQRYQKGSVNVQASLSFLNISQQVILNVCLATSLSLAAFGIKQRIDCCENVMGCDSGVSPCCQAVTAATCPGMQVGDFVAVLTYTFNLFAPLNFLGSIYNAVVMAVIDLTSMSELLAESPDVTDAPDAMEVPTQNARDPDVALEFDNVHFHYPSQPNTKGLKGLSFQMKRGTTTAIVGPTGAGKTTVSRLLFRFYDVLGGAVKINGVDVRSVTQKSLRGAIGVVPQAASLFNDTIRSNLLYGRRDATQEELVQAARDSQLLDFIESLDEKWETQVGDRGLKLSGGEKQRAAICRCLLKNPSFVLLDEATSALDTLTENSVQEALDRLGESRTVLVIAHRLGTIRNADNIIVLKDGIAHEQGTHDELMAKPNGVYAEMWNMQLHSTSASTSRVGLSDLAAAPGTS